MAVPVVVIDEGKPDDRRRIEGPPPPGRRHQGLAIAWVDDGAHLAVTTFGSSTAPTVPTTIEVHGQRLTLTLADRNPGGGPRSADYSAYVTVIEAPPGLDRLAPLVAHVAATDLMPPLTASSVFSNQAGQSP